MDLITSTLNTQNQTARWIHHKIGLKKSKSAISRVVHIAVRNRNALTSSLYARSIPLGLRIQDNARLSNSVANLEFLIGREEGVGGALHLRHSVPPRLLGSVVLVAVAMPEKRQRHHLLTPPPHRRCRCLTVSFSLFSLWWLDQLRKSTRGLVLRERKGDIGKGKRKDRCS
jgi:hypothetical protein